MKKIILLILLLTAGIVGCDEINPPYTENGSVIVDTTKQKVLLEDFTGFRCNNCPEAHDIATGIKAQYKGQVILMAIHAGSLATPLAAGSNYTYNFLCKEGRDIDLAFKVSENGTPNGLINRTAINGQKIINPDSWESDVAEEAAKTSNFKITAVPSYNAGTKTIGVDLNIISNADLAPNYSVAVYITEDSIINYQKDLRFTPEDIPNYVHMHVLRGSMTGTWGELVSESSIIKDALIAKNYTYSIPSTKDWKPEHLHLVVVIFDTEGLEVKQVEEVKLTPGS